MKVYIVSLRTESGDSYPVWKAFFKSPSEKQIFELLLSEMPSEFEHIGGGRTPEKEDIATFDPDEWNCYVHFQVIPVEVE